MSAAALLTGTIIVPAAANDHETRAHAAAAIRNVPVGVKVSARSSADDTEYYVAAGLFEFMVAGASAPVGEGGHVRVPAGIPHAWRNAGHVVGTLHVRSVARPPAGAPVRLVSAIARQ